MATQPCRRNNLRRGRRIKLLLVCVLPVTITIPVLLPKTNNILNDESTGFQRLLQQLRCQFQRFGRFLFLPGENHTNHEFVSLDCRIIPENLTPVVIITPTVVKSPLIIGR